MAFPRVGSVVQEVEAKFHQATLAKATSKGGMFIVNTRVYHCHTDTSSQIALLAELVDSSHEMRVVVAFMACGITAMEAVRTRTAAGGRIVGNTRNFSLGLVQLSDRRYLLDRRPRGDLLNNGSLVLVVAQQGEGAAVEESEGQVVLKSGRNAVVTESREEAGG